MTSYPQIAVDKGSYPRIGTIRSHPISRVIHALELYGLRILTICKGTFSFEKQWLGISHIYLYYLFIPVVRGIGAGEKSRDKQIDTQDTAAQPTQKGGLFAGVGLSHPPSLTASVCLPMVMPILSERSKHVQQNRRCYGHR